MKYNVLEWLEASADKYSDKIVYSDIDNNISFKELLAQAQAIGSGLLEYTSCKKQPIAVISSRNVFTPAIFLGIVYSGCCYAPMDGSMPVHRLNQILNLINPSVLIVDSTYSELVKELDYNNTVISYDTLKESVVNITALEDIRKSFVDTDPLYIISTSGSSGTPKGVVTSHRSLMYYIEAYSLVMGIDQEDIIGNQSPLDYIAAIRDIYLPLLCGASTVIIPKEYFVSPVLLFDFLNQWKVTSIGWSVSAFTVPTKLGAFDYGYPKYLKKVCFSGSVMPCSCLRIWQDKLPDTLFVNQYGPTEATASCTYYVVPAPVNSDDSLPIGIPYKNYRVFLLNENNKLCSKGELGEICVSGPILALGYYNNLELTRSSFIQNPLNNSFNELIYRTGDYGIMREDNILEFKGRMDRQIKHHGHRVELNEIDQVVSSLDGVCECCTLFNSEKEKIYLFVSGENLNNRDIAIKLRSILPNFMIPGKIIKLDSMPHLPNGKIDMVELKKNF